MTLRQSTSEPAQKGYAHKILKHFDPNFTNFFIIKDTKVVVEYLEGVSSPLAMTTYRIFSSYH
jgi:hypothetical protein